MFIITGIDSGLGKYLHKNLPGSIGINRKNADSFIKEEFLNATILHCAFNSKRDIKNQSIYIEDNYLFTKKLLNIKGIKTLIYFSSIDIWSNYSL